MTHQCTDRVVVEEVSAVEEAEAATVGSMEAVVKEGAVSAMVGAVVKTVGVMAVGREAG